MAKKKLDQAIDKKLDLGDTLFALDMRNKDYYNNLSDEMKKKYAPLVLMRFMSSAANQGGMQQYHLQLVNELVNEDFWTLSKHPELQHLLLCVCGTKKKQYHSWIPNAKRTNADAVFEFLKRIYPNLNDLEFKIFIKENSEEEFIRLAKDYALDDKEIEALTKKFKNAKKTEIIEE